MKDAAFLASGAQAGSTEAHELALALQRAPVFVRGLDGTITFWNMGSQELYGWTRDEAIGRIAHELFGTKFPEPLGVIERRLLRDGHWTGELQHRCKSGERLTIASRWILHRDRAGAPTAVIEVSADATGLRRTEEARLRLAWMVENSEEAIVVLALDGTILHWNHGAEMLRNLARPQCVPLGRCAASRCLRHGLGRSRPGQMRQGLFCELPVLCRMFTQRRDVCPDLGERLVHERLSWASGTGQCLRRPPSLRGSAVSPPATRRRGSA